jgi:hypothetical protein
MLCIRSVFLKGLVCPFPYEVFAQLQVSSVTDGCSAVSGLITKLMEE